MSVIDLPTQQDFIQEMSKVKIYSFSQPDWHFIFNSKTIILFILSFIAFSILLWAFLKREKIMERILKEDTGYQASLVFIVLFIISLMPLLYLTTYQSIANSYQFYQSIPDNGNSKVIHSEISVTNDKDIIHQIDLFKSATLPLAKNELQSRAINSCLKYGKVSNMDNFMNCLERETREDSLALHFYKFFSLLFSLAFFLSIVYIGIFFGDKELFNRIVHFFKKTFKKKNK